VDDRRRPAARRRCARVTLSSSPSVRLPGFDLACVHQLFISAGYIYTPKLTVRAL
jgi:hypothetical protein